MPVTLTLRRQTPENHGFKASLSYVANQCLTQINNQSQNKEKILNAKPKPWLSMAARTCNPGTEEIKAGLQRVRGLHGLQREKYDSYSSNK